ncbi:STAS domain-containing protein [Desulfonema magnum]|uniref:STAS domain-containing protein n=2 Tax=Desulfonema magnum TaxID=45655 RepID=A0A975GL13_9BACT|nr:STAS domain-containing protein [Desulfonema magnum]
MAVRRSLGTHTQGGFCLVSHRQTDDSVKAAAVVGIRGLQEILFNGVLRFTKRKMRLFNSIEEAKDWLVKK